jgi:hypothetical protein
MKKILFLAFLGTLFAATSAFAGVGCCGAEMAYDKAEKADKMAMTEKADKAEKAEPVAAACGSECDKACDACPVAAQADSCTRDKTKSKGQKTAASEASCPAMKAAQAA